MLIIARFLLLLDLVLIFLMFGHTPRIPLDVEMGVTLTEWGDSSHQNYVQKLRAQIEWAYWIAQENNQKESE